MRVSWIGSAVVLAFAVAVAQAAPKEDVTAAAKTLAEKANYSWKTTTESGGGGGGGRGRAGPTEGKTANGITHISMERGDNTIEAVLHGEKGAVKTEEGWQSLSELSGGGQGQGGGRGLGRFMANMFRDYELPAAQAQAIAGYAKELKEEGGAYTGELTEEGAKALMRFRRGRGGQGGGQGPEISDAKGTAKFWVKGGVLTKYEYSVQGTMSFQGNDREIKRTTTTEITNVGSTKVEVPSEAKEKLS